VFNVPPSSKEEEEKIEDIQVKIEKRKRENVKRKVSTSTLSSRLALTQRMQERNRDRFPRSFRSVWLNPLYKWIQQVYFLLHGYKYTICMCFILHGYKYTVYVLSLYIYNLQVFKSFFASVSRNPLSRKLEWKRSRALSKEEALRNQSTLFHITFTQ